MENHDYPNSIVPDAELNRMKDEIEDLSHRMATMIKRIETSLPLSIAKDHIYLTRKSLSPSLEDPSPIV